MSDVKLIERGYRITTAEILYHMPDHPALLQTFLWQALDLAPRYPVLSRFLMYWEKNLDGRLHSVRLAAAGIFSARELKHANFEFSVH